MKPTVDIVPISSIVCRDRVRGELGDIDALAKSIMKDGIIQPLAVFKEADGSLTLLAGGRRLEACRMANEQEIPVRIYYEIDELQQASIELAENLFRKDFTFAEEVAAKKKIHELMVEKYGKKLSPGDSGWSIANTAELLGESAVNTARDLQLADMIEQIPAIASCENKSEASRTLRKMEAYATNKVAEIKFASVEQPTAKKNLVASYVVGDFLEMGSKLTPRTFDIAEIDPPYGMDFENVLKHKPSRNTYKDVPISDYKEFLVCSFKHTYHALKDNSWAIVWFAMQNYQLVHDAICEAGFYMSEYAIPAAWVKHKCGQCMNPEYLLASSFECFFYARKGSPSIVQRGRSNVFQYAYGEKAHPTERPVELIEEVLHTFAPAGSHVLVPFAGSGATLLAAHNLSMTAVGYDINDVYKTEYTARIMSSAPPYYR